MMAAARTDSRLIERLPEVRGRYQERASLARLTWFGVGGPAEVLFQPADGDDLAAFLTARPDDVPVLVIGAGSNLLVRDAGVDGVVVRLAAGFDQIRCEGEVVHAGAGARDVAVAHACQRAGLGGLEFLRGIPGTIGGALAMNAGAYGHEFAEVLVAAEAVDGRGTRVDLAPADFSFGYRHAGLAEDMIVVAATLRGSEDSPEAIAQRMSAIQEARFETQPVKARTGGSTFVNPPGAKAWELIERAGCRGLRRGGAMVSEKHCNFLVNTGGASAADLEGLGEEVRRRVEAECGVLLEWEIRRVGRHAGSATIEVAS